MYEDVGTGPGTGLREGSRMKKMPPLCAAFALLVLWNAAASAGSATVVYADDVDQWRVDVYAGCPSAGGALQGPLKEAGIHTSGTMCFLPDGQAFLCGNGVVMTVTSGGTVRLFAGTPGLPGHQDGPVAEALLGRQISMVPDGKGGFFIGDRSNRCIRRIRQTGGRWVVQTVAGDPKKPQWKGKPVDGAGAAAVFRYLHSNVVADDAGSAYIMDDNYLRRIDPEGRVVTLNPDRTKGKPASGPLASARFSLIMGGGLAWDGKGCIYVADRWNFCVQKVSVKEKTTTIVAGPARGYRDGPAGKAGFHGGTTHIVYDPYRTRVYVTGADDWGLRALAEGVVRTIAGGNKRARGFEGPAKETQVHWCGVRAVDPRPPHDIYFHSNGGPWRGVLGRLFKAGDR
jgi:hypothetical protein